MTKISRRFYHIYLEKCTRRFSQGVFVDIYGLRYLFDTNSLIERQMAAAGFYEEDTKHLIDTEVSSGEIVIEVGSNFGGHTLPLACKVGAGGFIHAIEATDYAFDRLNHNIQLNSELSNIATYKTYISTSVDPEMEVEITSYWTPSGHNNNTQRLKVDPISLNSLFADISGVDLLKIDVDGADHAVLLSGLNLIQRYHPTIYIEVSSALQTFGSSCHNLCCDIVGLGYKLYMYSYSKKCFLETSFQEINEILHYESVRNILCRSIYK